MSTLRIVNGRVLRPDHAVERSDILIDQSSGKIERIGSSVPAGDDELDATDCLVCPGLTNAHTHASMSLLRGLADDKPLMSWLQEDIWPVEAKLSEADVRVGAKLGLLEMIKAGTTTIADMYFHVPEIVEAVEEAGIRAMLGHAAITIGKEEADARADLETSLEIASRYDGAANGRIRTAFQPHSLTTVERDYFVEYVPEARKAEVPIHFHANETRDDVESIVDAYGKRPLEYADELGLLGPDTFIAHGVHVNEAELSILAETGTHVIHCPASNMKLASGIAPVQEMLDRDVTVGIGTDGAASNNDLDPFDEMRDAAMSGKIAAGDAAAVPAEAVVRMATEAGASILGLSDGRIEEGAMADLAIIDFSKPHLTPVHDYVSHLAYAVTGADVRHTVCDGQVLMRNRTVKTLEEAAVKQEARERAVAVVERARD